eukprot:scaffold196144_cov18-Tisochrysis_lutea.AAC.1
MDGSGVTLELPRSQKQSKFGPEHADNIKGRWEWVLRNNSNTSPCTAVAAAEDAGMKRRRGEIEGKTRCVHIGMRRVLEHFCNKVQVQHAELVSN